MNRQAPQTYILLSIATALITMGLKFWAYVLTKSVGLFSDVAESSVNLIAALVALWALLLAAQPADSDHTFGHTKAEYFSSALEGTLILVAAVGITVTAVERLLHPQPLTALDFGLWITLVAAAINGGVALILGWAGQRLRSIALRADSKHLLTDVWTSVGIVLGLVIVKFTGWSIFDPLLALVVATHISWSGVHILRETMDGLMDTALSEPDQQVILHTLAPYQQQGIRFHALRTRMAGSRNFVSMHVLVPGDWSVQQGHQLCDELELAIMQVLPGTHVTTHLEPLEDPISWADTDLDRMNF